MFIYLDSVPLSAASWPTFNTGLKALVEAAALAQPAATIFIPEPVALEQEAQFMRDWTAKGLGAVRGGETAAKGYLARARLAAPQATQFPTTDELRAAYRASVATSMRELGIRSVPLIDRNVRSFFDALLIRQPPFDEQGRGLGDTLILESIVHHLEQHADVQAIFVTSDKDYKGVPALSGPLGQRLRILPIERASAALVEQAQADIRRTITTTIATAKASLAANFASLDQYLADRVEIPAWLFVERGESAVRVDSLNATSVYKIEIYPLNPAVDAVVKFAATVELKIQLTVEGAPPPPLPLYKVGEDWRKRLEHDLLLKLLTESREEEEPVARSKAATAVARIYGNAIKRADAFTDWTWAEALVKDWA